MKIEVLPLAEQGAGTPLPLMYASCSTDSIDAHLVLPGIIPIHGSQLGRVATADKRIDIIKTMFLRGPNIWTYRPVLEAWVDIGGLEDFPSNTIPGFYERLTAWLPTLVEHRCGVGERGGFLQRLREGTWPAHIVEHVMIELQNLAGIPTGFGKARQTSRRGVYKVVVRTSDEKTGVAALYAARDLVMAAIENKPFNVPAAVAQLRTIADASRVGAGAACIVDAAAELRIPSIRFNEGNLVQFGYGARQRRIWADQAMQSGAIAESIADDDELSRNLLCSCGVPVVEGRAVDDAQEAWEAAQDIGLPVIVRPDDRNRELRAYPALNTREEVEAAYMTAAEADDGVVVERFVAGDRHRLLIVGGQFVAAVRLQASSAGDASFDVTDLVHPDVAATAALAARVAGLDIAGVDLVAEDIARPLDGQQGAVVALRARPDLLTYGKPDHGMPRPVGRAIIDHWFGADRECRIPIVGITGSHGTTLVARLVSKLLHAQGTYVGLACDDGLFLNQRQVDRRDCANWESAQRILLNRNVQAAVFENSSRAILSEGLGYDRCRVGVVTGIDPADVLPEYFVEDAEQIVNVVRTQVDVVLPDGVAVLNAADRRVAELAPLCDGEVLFFAPTPDVPALAEHLGRHGRAAFVRNGGIVLASGAEEAVIADVSTLPSVISHQLEQLLAAAGTAWALGLPPEKIGAGLEAFIEDVRGAAANITPLADARSRKRKTAYGNLTHPSIARS